MALRSIDQRYWTDPYVESLSATEKLVYIHLFSSAHTNLVGVFQASRRMIAFQTACLGPDVDAALERFRRDGKAVIDGGEGVARQLHPAPVHVLAEDGGGHARPARQGRIRRHPQSHRHPLPTHHGGSRPPAARPALPVGYGIGTLPIQERRKRKDISGRCACGRRAREGPGE